MPPAPADVIAEPDRQFQSMVALEAKLLDWRRAGRAAMAAPASLLIGHADSHISAIARPVVRDSAGQPFDWAPH